MARSTAVMWRYITCLPDGHRLFQAVDGVDADGQPTGRYAITDDDVVPERADSGVLWLDQETPLRVLVDYDPESGFGNLSEHFRIPAVDDDGCWQSVATNARTFLYLSARLNWPIRAYIDGRWRKFTFREGVV